jgi:lipopolysaccharide biosynthesis glycosyltransferase
MNAIGLCVDSSCFVPALVTLVSFADAHDASVIRHTAIRMLSPDITAGAAETFATISRRLGFESFHYRRVALSDNLQIKHGRYISRATYLRFAFSERFIDRPLFLYLDSDILVTGDMVRPFNALPSNAMGAVRDEINHTVGIGPSLPGFVDQYPFYRGSRYYNAGALWFQTGFYETMASGAKRALKISRHIHFNDQDALNMWILSSNAAYCLPSYFNRFELGRFFEESDWIKGVIRPERVSEDASAIHFIGPQKPWLRSCPCVPSVRLYLQLLKVARRLIARSRDATLDIQT